jgi:hypothetical protein
LSAFKVNLIEDKSCIGSFGGPPPRGKVRTAMQDAIMLLFTVVFFAVAFLYVKACQKLR